MNLEAALTKAKKKRVCAVIDLLNNLDAANSKALKEAIDGTMGVHLICRAIRSEGLRLSETTIKAHREGQCPCAIE